MHIRKTAPQMCRLTGNTDDVPSLIWTVVVNAWLRANRHTNNYTQYSQPTIPHSNRHSTNLAKGMTQLSISMLNWVNYH